VDRHRLDADLDLIQRLLSFHANPDSTQSFTHGGKSGKFFGLLFTAVSASLHCFMFLVCFTSVLILNTVFGQYLEIYWKKV
jgi:hypothetical protein